MFNYSNQKKKKRNRPAIFRNRVKDSLNNSPIKYQLYNKKKKIYKSHKLYAKRLYKKRNKSKLNKKMKLKKYTRLFSTTTPPWRCTHGTPMTMTTSIRCSESTFHRTFTP